MRKFESSRRNIFTRRKFFEFRRPKVSHEFINSRPNKSFADKFGNSNLQKSSWVEKFFAGFNFQLSKTSPTNFRRSWTLRNLKSFASVRLQSGRNCFPRNLETRKLENLGRTKVLWKVEGGKFIYSDKYFLTFDCEFWNYDEHLLPQIWNSQTWNFLSESKLGGVRGRIDEKNIGGILRRLQIIFNLADKTFSNFELQKNVWRINLSWISNFPPQIFSRSEYFPNYLSCPRSKVCHERTRRTFKFTKIRSDAT